MQPRVTFAALAATALLLPGEEHAAADKALRAASFTAMLDAVGKSSAEPDCFLLLAQISRSAALPITLSAEDYKRRLPPAAAWGSRQSTGFETTRRCWLICIEVTETVLSPGAKAMFRPVAATKAP